MSEHDARNTVRNRRLSRAVLATGLALVAFGAGLVAAATAGTLDAAGLVLMALGVPVVVLADGRLARASLAGRGGDGMSGAHGSSAGWAGGDACGGGFDGGGFGGGFGGGGDGGGGGC
jgi:hypothetical protein